MENPKSKRLFNSNFLKVSLASLFMYTGFYLVMPIIAPYSQEVLGVEPSMSGIIAASYIITALLMRPFSGYFVDRYDRKKFYMTVFVLFALMFTGYIAISDTVGGLILTRVLLGATFSLVTTAAGTLAIDVVSSEHRADGIGYYAAIIVLAMAIGPMVGLYLIEIFSYNDLFKFATLSCWIGVAIGAMVKTKPHAPVIHEKLSLDRFFMREGLSMAAVISIIYFLYGSLMVYVALYIKELAIGVNSGNFFLFFALGIISARWVTGNALRHGKYNRVLLIGTSLIVISGILFTTALTMKTFIPVSLLLGLGFGMISPCIQSMIIDLGPSNRRGTANSTYYIAIDGGTGVGMLFGGVIAQNTSYTTLYQIGAALALFAIVVYVGYAKRNYETKLNEYRDTLK
ncbi:MAG: MFS transporter [Rikenellaceae bacterium]